MDVFVYIDGEMRRMIGTARALAQELKATAAQAEETTRRAREAERAINSAVALQGKASANQAGSFSGGGDSADASVAAQGPRGVRTDPLSQMRDLILQGLGRK